MLSDATPAEALRLAKQVQLLLLALLLLALLLLELLLLVLLLLVLTLCFSDSLPGGRGGRRERPEAHADQRYHLRLVLLALKRCIIVR